MRVATIACAAVVAVLSVAPLDAHHSLAADFDVAKPVTLKGRVTKIEWLNPHVHIYIDVDNGRTDATWSVELGSPNGLKERGFTAKTLKIGDLVTVDGSLAKDGSRLANARSIVLPNGVRMATGSGAGKTS
jgi:hypothetical protein